MDVIFLKLLNMSIAAGWLIMAVIFLRLIFRKAPKWIRCILWAIMACPLAFGEIGVKTRVKSVLNYKKPAFWIVIMSAAACVVAAVCFLTNPRKDAFDIKIVIPADSGQTIHYSIEEIFPNRSRITLSSGEGLSDAEEPVLPTEVKEEHDLAKSFEDAILNAILDRNSSYYPLAYNFACSDFVMLDVSTSPTDGDTAYIITFYGWALYQRYNVTEKGIEDVGGSHIPVALTFEVNENDCKLTEYWEPGDGSYYVPDIRNKFPEHIVDDGLDSQKYIVRQIQNCYSQAVRFKDLDTDAIIGSLLDKICSSPAESSNPYDYIGAHSTQYRELIYYGEYTLRYCLNRFNQGNETGLEGKVMAIVCEELLQTKDKIPENAGSAETGQLWYDTLRAHASNKVEPYIEKMGND